MQLLVAYGADVGELADAKALVEVTAFSASLELDDAVERLLERCDHLKLDLNLVLEQGVWPHGTLSDSVCPTALGALSH